VAACPTPGLQPELEPEQGVEGIVEGHEVLRISEYPRGKALPETETRTLEARFIEPEG
jgi:hypothetical protein